MFREYSDVVFRQGLPDVTDFDGSDPVLLIIDDLMDETVANIFTRGSHHRNVSVILLVQNLFLKNKHVRTISLDLTMYWCTDLYVVTVIDCEPVVVVN